MTHCPHEVLTDRCTDPELPHSNPDHLLVSGDFPWNTVLVSRHREKMCKTLSFIYVQFTAAWSLELRTAAWFHSDSEGQGYSGGWLVESSVCPQRAAHRRTVKHELLIMNHRSEVVKNAIRLGHILPASRTRGATGWQQPSPYRCSW